MRQLRELILLRKEKRFSNELFKGKVGLQDFQG